MTTNVLAIDAEWNDTRYFGNPIIGGCSDGYDTGYGTPAYLKETINEHEGIIVAHNAKADFRALDIWPDTRVADTLVMAWLCNENGAHGLKDLSKHLLDRELQDPVKVRDHKVYWRDYNTPIESAPWDEVGKYCAEDARAAWDLYQLLNVVLEDEGLSDWYWCFEEPFLRVLWEMERRGVAINEELLATETAYFAEQVEKTEAEIYKAVGYEFNLNSNKQLQQVLYTKKWSDRERGIVGQYKNGKDKPGWIEVPRSGLGLKTRRKTNSGQLSTDEVTLEALGDHPIVSLLLKYRELNKLLSTYLEAVPNFMRNGRLYGKFNPTGAVTGRLSSSEPNLQNIPIRSELGKRLRSLFISPKGKKLVVADLSQIEYRLLAHFTKDPLLIKTFREGQDVHQQAAEVLGIERAAAKNTNYADIYGAGPRKIAQMCALEGVHLSVEEIKEIQEKRLEQFPRVQQWKVDQLEKCSVQGHVETIGGRKRRLPGINSWDGKSRSMAERQAINSIIQGSAADLMKVAMVRMSEKHVPLLLQIHDEIVAECTYLETKDVARAIEESFQEAAEELGVKVPVTTDVKVCDSWAEKS